MLGHRGASATHVENTLEALAAAKEQGADGVEIDVRRTADDVLVLHHDAKLDDGRLLRSLSADELPAAVPTLVDALEMMGDLFVDIEIKNSPADPDYDAEFGISLAVAGLVAAFDAYDRCLVTAFELDNVLRIREVDPSVPIGWLTWGQADPASLVARAEFHGLQSINPHDRQVDLAFVQRAHGSGLAVHVWTVDDPDRARELAGFGVDGIITNDPRAVIAALDER